MPAVRTKAEREAQKTKLANSYQELLEEFSSKDLRHVGNYTLGKLIGKGSFGKVYLATHNLTNKSKVVLKSSNKDDSNLAREIHHHRQFLHPHIARLYEVIVTEKLVWLALEYCPGDELYNYLLRHGAIPPEKVQKIFTQLVGAVAYVHDMSCVHRDLKLENILLDKNENVKLCDFGFTREYEGKSSYLQTFCGTVCYSAPEMLKGEKYAGEKVDVWSLGIILYALLTGELPFDEDDDQATKQKILTTEPKYPEAVPEDAKALISLLLSKRPLLRPSLADILAHPFLAEYAPQQQAILKLTQPAPFSTSLEKTTLERMKSAGVDIDSVIESVLAQKCDPLAGWWALLIEKEGRKERRRERKRKEREAEAKLLRRLSGASSRLERLTPALLEVDEEGHSSSFDYGGSRGRRDQRRSLPTPQIIVPDLPQLPEGSAIDSAGTATPPPPIEKDHVRSNSSSRNRPPPPPKDLRQSRTSTLNLVTNNPDLLTPNGTVKRSSRRHQHAIINQLAALKHWFIESAKRARSPNSKTSNATTSVHTTPEKKIASNITVNPARHTYAPISTTHAQLAENKAPHRVSSASLTPTHHSSFSPRPVNTNNHHRNSLSPSPLTPRSSYRRSSAGLRGRKSTSSSVSSVRSIHHVHSHSKASSTSSASLTSATREGHGSGSIKTTTITARSPHSSVKVLPATPTTTTHFPSNIRVVRSSPHTSLSSQVPSLSIDTSSPTKANSVAQPPLSSPPPNSLVFARRKKSVFKGPMLNTSFFAIGTGSPPAPYHRRREQSDASEASSRGKRRRRSQIIEEEDEEAVVEEEGEETEVEEVEQFSPVDAGGEEVIVEEGEGGDGWDDEVEDDLRGRSPGPWIVKRKPVVPSVGDMDADGVVKGLSNADVAVAIHDEAAR